MTKKIENLLRNFYKEKYSHLFNCKFERYADKTIIWVKCLGCENVHNYEYVKNIEKEKNHLYDYRRIGKISCDIFHKSELDNIRNQMKIDDIDRKMFKKYIDKNIAKN